MSETNKNDTSVEMGKNDNKDIMEIINLIDETNNSNKKEELKNLLKEYENPKIDINDTSREKFIIFLNTFISIDKEGLSKIKILNFTNTILQDDTRKLFFLLREYDESFNIYKSSVEELILNNCEITFEGFKSIAFGLSTNTTLKKLDLSMNEISNTGVYHLMHSLTSDLRNNKTSIEFINLSRNIIGDLGAEKIAELIEKNYTIKEIDLSDNEITDKGALLIFKQSVKKNIKIILDNNNLKINENKLLGKIKKKQAVNSSAINPTQAKKKSSAENKKVKVESQVEAQVNGSTNNKAQKSSENTVTGNKKTKKKRNFFFGKRNKTK